MFNAKLCHISSCGGGNDPAVISPEADHNRSAVKEEQVEVRSHRTGGRVKANTGGAPDVAGSGIEVSLPPPEANCVSC